MAHHRSQSRQGCRRIDVDAIEEDGETGYDDFLGRNTGDEGQTDLPVPQADGRKERHDGLADDGPETVGHIAIAGRAEVEDEPHEDGSSKDDCTGTAQVILDFFPDIDVDRMSTGPLIFRKLDEQVVFLFLMAEEVHRLQGCQGDDDADEVHGIGDDHGIVWEEHARKEDVNGQAGAAGHKRRNQHCPIAVALIFQGPRRHDGRYAAAKAEDHGDKGPSGQTQTVHYIVHDIGYAGHVTAVFQEGQSEEEDTDVGQKGQDAANAGDDAITDQGNEHIVSPQRSQAAFSQSRQGIDGALEGILDHIADEESQEKDDGHDGQEDGDAQPFIGQVAVDGIGCRCFRRLVDDDFMDDFFDEGIFFGDDIRFITAVQDVMDVVDGILGRNFRVPFEELQRMPAVIVQIGIFVMQELAHGVDAVFHGVAVDHGEFTVMIMLMMGMV